MATTVCSAIDSFSPPPLQVLQETNGHQHPPPQTEEVCPSEANASHPIRSNFRVLARVNAILREGEMNSSR